MATNDEKSPKGSGTLDQNTHPLLSLRESGKRLWANEPADDYVRRLREGWE
jgi:hypothetical protein